MSVARRLRCVLVLLALGACERATRVVPPAEPAASPGPTLAPAATPAEVAAAPAAPPPGAALVPAGRALAEQVGELWPTPTALAFERDAALVVTFADGRGRQWRPTRGWSELAGTPPEPRVALTVGDGVWCVPDRCVAGPAIDTAVAGQLALIDDGTAIVKWDLRTLRPTASLPWHADPARRIGVARDRTAAVIAGARWHAFWDLARDTVVAVRRDEATRMVALADDGSIAAIASDRFVETWDVRTARRRAVARLPGSPRLLAVSASGAWTAIAGDGWVQVHGRAGELAGFYGLALRRAAAAAHSPDGRWLAMVDPGGTVDVIDAQTGTTRRMPDAPEPQGTGPVYLDFSPDGRWLLRAGPGAGVVVWDVDTAQVRVRALHPESRWEQYTALFVDRLVMRRVGDDACIEWDLETGAVAVAPACAGKLSGPPRGPTVAAHDGVVVLTEADAAVGLVALETASGPDFLAVGADGARFVPEAAPPRPLPGVNATRSALGVLLRSPGTPLPAALRVEAGEQRTPPADRPTALAEPPRRIATTNVPAPSVTWTAYGCVPALTAGPRDILQGRATMRLLEGAPLAGDPAVAPRSSTPGCGATLRRMSVAAIVHEGALTTLLDRMFPVATYRRERVESRDGDLFVRLTTGWRLQPRAVPGTVLWARLVRRHGQVWVAVADAARIDRDFLEPAVETSLRSLRVRGPAPRPERTPPVFEPEPWPPRADATLLHLADGSRRVTLRADGQVHGDGGATAVSLPAIAAILDEIDAAPAWRPAAESGTHHAGAPSGRLDVGVAPLRVEGQYDVVANASPANRTAMVVPRAWARLEEALGIFQTAHPARGP